LTADQHFTRRLAADVVGYTRLMGEDETGTHRQFSLVWTQVFNPAVARYSGDLEADVAALAAAGLPE
jgi:class 3 adenylate cyclase